MIRHRSLLLALILAPALTAGLVPARLRCEYRADPAGIDVRRPRLSWILESRPQGERNQKQAAWQILVASDLAVLGKGRGDLWNSGKVASSQQNQIEYAGKPLASGVVCYWKVRVWDRDDRSSPWSEPARWSMGLLDRAEWKAKWILDPGTVVEERAAQDKKVVPIQPVAGFRRSFRIEGSVRRATAYATALGVYELRINGRRVDDRALAPEFTDYRKRVQYQTYDVTGLLRPGENAAAALLGAGWYAGKIGLFRRQVYGAQTRFLMRLEIELAGGRKEVIVTDGSWRRHPAPPEVSADILDGVTYDARKETPGWDAPGFADAGWPNASVEALQDAPEFSSQPNEPIRPVKQLRPVAVTEPAAGVYVVDLGQNMVGWCRLRLRGPAGRPIRIRHAEALQDDGHIYTANLRGAPQVDTYIPRSGEVEPFEPLFTYHGFRYIELTGLAAKPRLEDITGVVVHSAAPDSGRFETSNPMLNRLMANIVWTQRANLYSTPTDCPQRDERLGWMGDIQTFAQTGIFNMDLAAFFTKWLRDVRDDQSPDGRFPDFAPNPNAGTPVDKYFGAPGWGDAGVIVPWRIYQNYGDRRLLEESFDSARRWVEQIERRNPNLLWEKGREADYNDWLNADTIIQQGWPRKGGEIPKPMFATAFWAHSTDLVARMAAVLGRREEAPRYRKLFEGIRDAFNRAWVHPDGGIDSDTQAAYALALHFDLLPAELRAPAVEKMIAGGARYGGHLSTGIHGTHRLMLELAREGRTEEAYRLLQLRSFPSWGFMIDNGATTIWERWDGYVKGRGFQNPGMNSLNHWALGAVGEWMWRTIVGLSPDEQAPGFERFVVAPRPGGGLGSASGTYESIRGPIRIAWTIREGVFTLHLSVPPNSEAIVSLPSPGASEVRAGSGEHVFRSRR